MDINELKQLLNNGTTNMLIMEDGKPVLVVVSYEHFKEMALGQNQEIRVNHLNGAPKSEELKSSLGEEELEILERINKDIQALKDELEKEEKVLTE